MGVAACIAPLPERGAETILILKGLVLLEIVVFGVLGAGGVGSPFTGDDRNATVHPGLLERGLEAAFV